MSRSVKEFLRDENVSHQMLSHSQNVATWNNFEKSNPNIVYYIVYTGILNRVGMLNSQGT